MSDVAQIDLNANDRFSAPSFPTALLYNPQTLVQTVAMNTSAARRAFGDNAAVDLYETTSDRTILTGASLASAVSVQVPAGQAIVVVAMPAGSTLQRAADGQVTAEAKAGAPRVVRFRIPSKTDDLDTVPVGLSLEISPATGHSTSLSVGQSGCKAPALRSTWTTPGGSRRPPSARQRSQKAETGSGRSPPNRFVSLGRSSLRSRSTQAGRRSSLGCDFRQARTVPVQPTLPPRARTANGQLRSTTTLAASGQAKARSVRSSPRRNSHLSSWTGGCSPRWGSGPGNLRLAWTTAPGTTAPPAMQPRLASARRRAGTATPTWTRRVARQSCCSRSSMPPRL